MAYKATFGLRLTDTGLVLGDFTIDYLRDRATNTDHSVDWMVGASLEVAGVGAYRLVCPAATGEADLHLHKTTDALAWADAVLEDTDLAVALKADQAVNVTKVNGTAQTAGDLAALVTTLDGVADGIAAKTVNLPASPAAVGSNMGSVASVTADVGITQAAADKAWGSATRTLTAQSDTSGTTTLLSRVPGTVQPQTGDAYARIGAAGAGLTALGDTRIANLDAAVSSHGTGTALDAAAVQAADAAALTAYGAAKTTDLPPPIVGAGADTVTLTVNDGAGAPITGCLVWVSTDFAGLNVVAGTLTTNDQGKATFMLTHGAVYYAWRRKAGVVFSNPVQFTAARD